MLDRFLESRNRSSREWTMQRPDFRYAIVSLDHVSAQPRTIGRAKYWIASFSSLLSHRADIFPVTTARTKDTGRERSRLKLRKRAPVALGTIHVIENRCHFSADSFS
jgi:hypothetical protein